MGSIEKRPSCYSKNYGTENYAIRALNRLTSLTIEILQFGDIGVMNVSISPYKVMIADFPPGTYVRVPEFIYMACSRDIQDFPNACSGRLTVQVLKPFGPNDPPGDRIVQNESYGMALYYYSSYNVKDRKIHERIQAMYALNSDGMCAVNLQSSGSCFGLGLELPKPEDPPRAPRVKGTSPRFPEVYANRLPHEGEGIWPFLAILLLFLAMLGAGLFFMRRKRLLREERALRPGRPERPERHVC